MLNLISALFSYSIVLALFSVAIYFTRCETPVVYNLICEIQRKYEKPIDFEMFIDSICTCLGNRESKEGIRRIYNLFDDDKTGYITFKNLKRVCENLGEMITDDELHEIISRVDSTGEGHIIFEDFYAIMMKKKF